MHSETPDIIPFTSPVKHEVLTAEQLGTLKQGTLHLLNEVGIRFPSKVALQIFADHGAKVDWENKIVRIPPDLVDRAMSSAPRSFVLGGREERFDLTLDGSCSYLATDGCGVRVMDLETRTERPSRKEDVAQMARVCDALPLISFFWPLVSAQDHGLTAPLHECHAGLTNTLKHVRGGTTVFPQLAQYIVEMATVVAGSEGERRRRPPVCANICTVAPLAQDDDGIASALAYAEAGIPTSFMAMPTMGSTAPATPMGALVIGDAEVVSAMVLIQLAYPGAPVFHSNLISLMDPRTGGYISDTSIPLVIMATQMAHAWNVPTLGGGSVSSDGKHIGWQSGSKSGLGSVIIPLAGGEICGYLGMLDGSMLLYPEQVILDHEICREAYDYFREYEFDISDLALDVIENVGPGSHFLLQKHTRKHIRDFHLSPVLHSNDSDGHKLDPQEAALAEFKRIDETHHPEPLPQEKLLELDRILEAADREAEKIG
ncbi:MAG TPA: trimethylamine methyltransferase family protein [Anaerolineales bacterium]|nr:trimethylamine methyltransferase family protein [Anaerolineales bacterium]